MATRDWQAFDAVMMHVRGYFVHEYHAGTREMVFRYVFAKMGHVEPFMISASLKILRQSGAITYDKRVWWWIADV